MFESGTVSSREFPVKTIDTDLAIAGGGLAGVCCAITAAREGLRVTLIQDRPVLGGNASSEVRLWVLGATSHMGNNNRWAREGGVMDEILVENTWRNPEGNPIIVDSILLEWVSREPNIQLLLNTSVCAAEKEGDRIRSVEAFCSQNQTKYLVHAPLFCDASGDGVLGFLAGASFRIGAEGRSAYGEGMAPEKATSELLGHSLYFYSRDTGAPVKFIPPAFALDDITKIPRFRELRASDSGCRLWWLEYGGNRDTVHETEEIKWELWKVAYGVWNYIKNSGNFPESETYTLEWMGTIPGKRESRRFYGDYTLTQNDIIQQNTFDDAVSYGGWAIDLHPSDGVYSPKPGCTQWHSKGVYQIPFRTLYSRDVPNLFLAGRIISASHIAFGSTRVMGTCAHSAQAVGMAAAMCIREKLTPRDLLQPMRMHALQQKLLRTGQHIPGIVAADNEDKVVSATISASSMLEIAQLQPSGEYQPLSNPYALLVPCSAGKLPAISLTIKSTAATTLQAEWWSSSRSGNTTPDVLLDKLELRINTGENEVTIASQASTQNAGYAFLVLPPNEAVSVAVSKQMPTGILTLVQKMNAAVAKSAIQTPPPDSGVDTFPYWLPERRPAARNLAAKFNPPLRVHHAENIRNGYSRPWNAPNAWTPAYEDEHPVLTLAWDAPQSIKTIEITFDTDMDHPMESVLMSQPERQMRSCPQSFSIYADDELLIHVPEFHQTRFIHRLASPRTISSLRILPDASGAEPPAIFEVRCY